MDGEVPASVDRKVLDAVRTTINEEELDNVYNSYIQQWKEQAATRRLAEASAAEEEGSAQAQVAQDLTGLLKQAVEPPEEGRIQQASEQVLVEGATPEEVEAERQAAIAAQEAAQQQQDRERIDKDYAKLSKNVRDFLSPVSVVTYMKDLTIKRQGKGNLLSPSAVSNISDSTKMINALSIPYLQQNEPYSFKQKDIKSYPQVKKLYILSFLLKRVAKIKQLSK
jgi:hypothetical protein